MTISVVISTHNRSHSLARTLRSVKPLADEIIVIDSGSTDDTAAIAKKYTKFVFKRPNNLMLNVNKNFGFSKATGDWILNLDDDEVIPEELTQEIRERLSVEQSDVSGFWIPRKNIIFGRWIQHGLWWPDEQMRLFRHGKGAFPEKHVHEYVTVSGKTGHLSESFIHYNYDTINQYLSKMTEIYIESELHKYEAAGYKVTWKDSLRFPVSDFLKIYFAQEGYKDGLHGLVLAILQAFYSFIIFAKLWERTKFQDTSVPLSAFTDEAHKLSKEIRYWIDTARLKESSNPIVRSWHKVLRRIRNV